VNTFGWWALSASQIAFMTNFILGIKVLWNNDWPYASTGWTEFLVYVAITFLFTIVNLVGCRKEQVLPWFNNFVGIWFAGLFVAISIAMLAAVGSKADLHYQPASFVFGAWQNQTGWPSGVTWFIGLVQAAYGLTAFDAVIHMIEEIPAPRTNAPKAIYLSVACGAGTGFIFLMVCLFCIQDFDAIVNSVTGLPFMDLLQTTVGLQGATVLLTLFIFNGLGQGVSIVTTASRLTWAFARDRGLPWGAYFTHVDRTWNVPARALWLQGFIIAIVGVLYLFANTVLEAILSVSTIALTISYAIPIMALLVVGRDKLPPGEFSLGRFGPLINYISVAYCAVTTVFFFFPGDPSPSPADMNYAIAVFAVMLVIALGFWFVKGRTSYLRNEDTIARFEYTRQQEATS
jgi:choline transport protein